MTSPMYVCVHLHQCRAIMHHATSDQAATAAAIVRVVRRTRRAGAVLAAINGGGRAVMSYRYYLSGHLYLGRLPAGRGVRSWRRVSSRHGGARSSPPPAEHHPPRVVDTR